MSLEISPAKIEDASAIATIWSTAMNSALDVLKWGTVDVATLVEDFIPVIENEIEHEPNRPYLVVRDNNRNGEVISYVQWELIQIDKEDNIAFEGERAIKYMDMLAEGLNKRFILEYRNSTRMLCKDCVGDRPFFKLRNLSTHPRHERRGAASQLIRWGLEKADSEGKICYVDTGMDGKGRLLYERFGFKAIKSHTFDLAAFGGVGNDGVVGMIREPV